MSEPSRGGFDIGNGDAYGETWITRTCEASVPALVGWLVCGERAIAVRRYACVHEHVHDRPTCGEHQPQLGIVGCKECWDAGHECGMEARLVEVIA